MFDLRPLVSILSRMSDGEYAISVKRIRNRRSNDQNAWLWGCIYPLLRQGLNSQGWEFTTDEQVHTFFKQITADEQVLNRNTGEVLTIPNSTREMDTATFSAYCEKLRDYGREFLGVEIPDPMSL